MNEMPIKECPAYYAIIPASVRYDKRITANAKLLYGEITSLCNEKGFCWASNNYFANLYDVTPQAISKWIKALSDFGYVKLEYEYNGKEIKSRKIYIAGVSTQGLGVSTNNEGGINKRLKGYQQKVKENITFNIKKNNIANTPLVKREPKNEYEKVEKEYLLNYEKLYEHHKVQTDKPIVNWNKTRAILKQLFLTLDSKIIITALKRATQDDFCLETGYSLDVILSKAVLNRLINSKNTENIEKKERTCPICGSHDIGPIGCRACHYDFCTPPDEWKKMMEEEEVVL